MTTREPQPARRRGRLFILSGPSGAGKSTITREVLRRVDAMLSVSTTTRPPRANEREGRDYNFVDTETFSRLIDAGALLEWATVFGHRYGTPAEPVDRAMAEGRTVVLEIDVQGGLQVARRRREAVGILIVPPDDKTLRQRLIGRDTDAADQVARRLAEAHAELKTARDSGVYTHEVVNDDLDEAVRQVVAILSETDTTED